MDYNQNIIPEVSHQNINNQAYMLADQFEVSSKGPDEREFFKEEPQVLKNKLSLRRTSEDDRLEYLGYNY